MQNPNAQRTTGFQVREPAELLCFIMNALSGISRNKAKAILAGGGVTVNGRAQQRHDWPLQPGDHVEIKKRKPGVALQSKFVKLVYEDAFIIVVEKSVGILSMASSATFCASRMPRLAARPSLPSTPPVASSTWP